MNLQIGWVFITALITYALLLGLITFFYTRSEDQRTAQENLPKTIKHITEGFVAIIIFLLAFYLAINGSIPKEVLITLISVFATAGFLNIRNK